MELIMDDKLNKDDAAQVANDFILANQLMATNLMEAGQARDKRRTLDAIIAYTVSQIRYTNNLTRMPGAPDFMDERAADELKNTPHGILD